MCHPNTKGLETLFDFRSIAVVGATDKSDPKTGLPSIGRACVENLIASGRKVFPINPNKTEILGIPVYPHLRNVPVEEIDVVMILIPASRFDDILDTVKVCHDKKVKAIIVITAGFGELGEEGKEHERLLKKAAGDIRILGPNCFGIMSPVSGINSTFMTYLPKPGKVAIFSQSGSIMAESVNILRGITGFSRIASIGCATDISIPDLLAFVASDNYTESAIIYMESVNDGEAFLKASDMMRKAGKPIFVIKTGRTEIAAKAAKSHTGSLVGNDAVFEAALERAGVIRLYDRNDFYNLVILLNNIKIPRGAERVFIASHAGGACVQNADNYTHMGGKLAKLSEETLTEMDTVLAKIPWSHNNPCDMTGNAGPKEYAGILKVALDAPEIDIILLSLDLVPTQDPRNNAEAVIKTILEHPNKKPIIAEWIGGNDWIMDGDNVMEEARMMFRKAGVAEVSAPGMATRLIYAMVKWSQRAKKLEEMGRVVVPEFCHKIGAENIISSAKSKGHTTMTTFEAEMIFHYYGIPTLVSSVSNSLEEAVHNAKKIGFPIVMKIHSQNITHKKDVGGVIPNLNTEQEVINAFNQMKAEVTAKVGAEHFQGITISPMVKLSDGYEIILGMKRDPIFGPVIMFGWGGTLTEIMKDTAIALAPLNTAQAREMMEKTKIWKVLSKEFRGTPPSDVKKIEDILVRLSHLAMDFPEISEFDINPLFVSPKNIVALDARIELNISELAINK